MPKTPRKSFPAGSPGGPSPSDADDLRDALDKIRFVLNDAVSGAEPAVSTELRAYFVDAWPEIQQAFKQLDQIIAARKDVFRLAHAGLTGQSLRLKVEGLRRAFGRLIRGGARRLRRRIRAFLAWGNTILDSLAQVFPVAEIIKEYKECVEHDLAERRLA